MDRKYALYLSSFRFRVPKQSLGTRTADFRNVRALEISGLSPLILATKPKA